MHWDFISSENSTGLHSLQEAARVLGDALNDARMAQISAERLTAKLTSKPGTDPLLQINTDAVIGTAPISITQQISATGQTK